MACESASHEQPSVSKDVIHTATLVRAMTVLFSHSVLLTVELSILLCALDLRSPVYCSFKPFQPRIQHLPCRRVRMLGSPCSSFQSRKARSPRSSRWIRRDRRFWVGDFIVPSLRIKFYNISDPGDVIFIKGQMLEHFITPWTGRTDKGERFCITHFTHQTLVDSVARASQSAFRFTG